MPTLGQALADYRDRLFVGRQAELAAFDRWIEDAALPPSILNVSGIGGSGKTELLHAFVRHLNHLGITAHYLDGRTVRASRDELSRALEPARRVAPSATGRPTMVLLIDTYEEIGAHDRWFRESFLSHLDSSVRIVLAGRYPVDRLWMAFGGWTQLVRSLPIGPLSEADAREYLRRRGIVDAALSAQLWSFTRGHPLTLCLATDLAQRLGLREFSATPERYLVLQTLSRQILAEVEDRQFRELLEAASMVRQFDEAMLAALVGKDQLGDTFEQLCRLSIVRPTAHGLAVHDVVRRALTNELRWRNPQRYAELRSRALAFYSSRFRSASTDDRHWLVADWLSFSTRALIQHLMFEEIEPGEIIVEPAASGDADAIRRIRARSAAARAHTGDDAAASDVVALSPSARVVVARNWDGEVVGYSVAVPVSRATLPALFGGSPVTTHLVAAIGDGHAPEQSDHADDIDTFVIWDLAPGDGLPAVQSALIRDLIGLFARGQRYLVLNALPKYLAFLTMLGFRPIAVESNEDGNPCMELDLRTIGAERWVEAVLKDELPPLLDRDTAAHLQPVVQEVLAHWNDDAFLAGSPLLRMVGDSEHANPRDRAKAVRDLVCHALRQVSDKATDDERHALHAVELAYLQRSTSHERLAERLAVSRSTLYRMLNRGGRILASHLGESNREP